MEELQVEKYLQEIHQQDLHSSVGIIMIPNRALIGDDENALFLLEKCEYNKDEALRRRTWQVMHPDGLEALETAYEIQHTPDILVCRDNNAATNEVITHVDICGDTEKQHNNKEKQFHEIQGPERDVVKDKDTVMDIEMNNIGGRIDDINSDSEFEIGHEGIFLNSDENDDFSNIDVGRIISYSDRQEKHFVGGEDNEADIEKQDCKRCRENDGQDDIVEIKIKEVIHQVTDRQDGQSGVSDSDDHKDVNDTEEVHDIIRPELNTVLEGCDLSAEQAIVIYGGSSNNSPPLNIGKWGAVVVVKGGADIAVYPMDSDLLSIGSAETDDIRVKTAAKHEAFIEVNHQGEIYLVNSSTQEVECLSHNRIFEVGGRALRWKAKTDNQGQNHDPGGTENAGQSQDKGQDSVGFATSVGQDTCQQGEENMMFVVMRDDQGFRLAACDEPQQGDMITDNRMHGFVPDSDSGAESDVISYPMLNSVLVTDADSTISVQSEGQQKKKVMAVCAIEDRAGKVDYSKRHACIFCGQLDLKMARHLCSKKHENEELIARLPPVSKPGSELQRRREKMLDALRNEGDFIYNIDILKSGNKNKGGIIVAKRPSQGTHSAEDYLPCKFCLRFYVKSELWRHGVNCSFRQDPLMNESNSTDEKESSRFIKSGRMLLHGAGVLIYHGEMSGKNEEEFYTYVLESLQNDTVGRRVKKDSGLILYGKTEFERLGRRRANEVRYRMRLLERVKSVVKSMRESDSSMDLESLLTADRFPSFIQAVRTVVGISEERSLNGVMMFDKPELARKVGQMIKKFAEIIEGRFVVNGNREARQNVTDFLFLYTTQWKSKIGSIAHQTSAEKKFNKKVALPLTEDLQKVQQHLDKEIVKQGNMLQKCPCAQTWKEFAKVLLTKLTLFNFRRGNECAAMQVAKFQQRNDWKLDNLEIYQSLQRFEQELAQRMDLVEVMGKQNKKVPVLLTPVMKAAIEKLIQHRDMCGVDQRNIYVFAKGQKKFIEGSEALRYVLEQVPDLKRPESLRFPSMRKYLATVVQVFGMSENEVQEVARHMGHELSVHKKFYRLQDDVIELAKIAKLLLAVESGKAHQFKGLSLDDLDFNDIPEGDDENFADDPTVREVPVEYDGYECDTSRLTVPDSVPVSSYHSARQRRSSSLHVGSSTSTETDAGKIPLLPNEDYDAAHVGNIGVQQPGNVVRAAYSRKKPVRLKRRQRESQWNEHYEFDDSDKDPDYKDDDIDSSDSDEEPVVKRKATEKRKWTEEEKVALKPLVLKAYRQKKPPNKSDITELLNKNSILKIIPWLKIKYQVWAMAQQKLKQAKMVVM